jgi:hypothetical protein
VKHSSTRELYAYWNTRRSDKPAPHRADIDPAAIRHSLSDIFILAADFVEEQRFRLAGTRVCALFARELKGESFGSLWSENSRDHLRALLDNVTEDKAAIVAGVTGRNDEGNPLDLELLLLPLMHQGHARVRAIGVLAATELPFWLGARPVKDLTLGTVRHLGGELDSKPRRFAAHLGGQLRRGFMVYQGGAAPPPVNPPRDQAG